MKLNDEKETQGNSNIQVRGDKKASQQYQQDGSNIDHYTENTGIYTN